MIRRQVFLRAIFFIAFGCGEPVNPVAEASLVANPSALITSAKPVTIRKPDLIVTAFSTTPANPMAGDQVAFTATIRNAGLAATPGGVVLGIAFYNAQNTVMATSNNYSTSLPAGGVITLVTNTKWTAQAGTQAVKAFVDYANKIKESDETNNTLTQSVTVSSPPVIQPDLVITNVSHSPADPIEGDVVTFTATVRNNGTGATPAGTILSIGYKDSAGNTIATSNTHTSSLAAGASVNLVTNSNWTAVPGAQSIVATVDETDRISESNESNNTLAHSVSVAAAPVLVPDLVVTTILHSPADPIEGDTVTFTATVKNNGTGATPAGTILSVGYKDSAGNTIATSNTHTSSLAAGASVNLVTNSNWTAVPGAQSIVATVDETDRISESDESNNTMSYSVSVAAAPVLVPDLVVTTVSHSPADPIEGDTVTFTATVKNNGTGATPAGTILSVGYKDSAGNTIATSNTHTSSLAAGASVNLVTNSNWTAVPGAQSIVATVDEGNNISEENESNNSFTVSVSVSDAAPPLPIVAAKPAFSFVDSIGVNSHFAFNAFPYYTQYAQVKARLLELGVKHIRDGSGSSSLTYMAGTGVTALLNDLAASGIKLNLITNLKWPASDIPSILAANQASLEAIEGQNEADVFVSGDWVTLDRAFQMLLWDTVKASSFSWLPVYLPSVAHPTRFSLLGDLSAYGDYGNIHPYPGGMVPLTSFNTWMSNVVSTSGNLPVLVTETGYNTAVQTTSGHQPVSERGEGKYVPRLFLDFYAKGISRTYLYQFYDHLPPSTTNIEANFGLVRFDFSVRPAFTSLKNMIALLNDSPANVPEGGLAFSLSTPSTSVRSALFKKTNGHYFLVLWQDVSVWSTRTRTDIVNPDVPVTITLDSPTPVKVYQPSVGTEVQSSHTSRSVDVSVPDEIVILEISP